MAFSYTTGSAFRSVEMNATRASVNALEIAAEVRPNKVLTPISATVVYDMDSLIPLWVRQNFTHVVISLVFSPAITSVSSPMTINVKLRNLFPYFNGANCQLYFKIDGINQLFKCAIRRVDASYTDHLDTSSFSAVNYYSPLLDHTSDTSLFLYNGTDFVLENRRRYMLRSEQIASPSYPYGSDAAGDVKDWPWPQSNYFDGTYWQTETLNIFSCISGLTSSLQSQLNSCVPINNLLVNRVNNEVVQICSTGSGKIWTIEFFDTLGGYAKIILRNASITYCPGSTTDYVTGAPATNEIGFDVSGGFLNLTVGSTAARGIVVVKMVEI